MYFLARELYNYTCYINNRPFVYNENYITSTVFYRILIKKII